MDIQKLRNLSPGDLLFWTSISTGNTEGANFDKAVSSAGGGDAPFHVSLVESICDQKITIIDAIDRGVVRDDLEDNCNRLLQMHSAMKIQHCTVANVDESIKKKALEFAASKLGCAYNDIFAENCINSNGQEAYYCCQFVRKCYDFAAGYGMFKLEPLNFRHTDGSVIEYWVDYFHKRGLSVPENEFGSNPAGLMRQDCVKVIDEVVMN